MQVRLIVAAFLGVVAALSIVTAADVVGRRMYPAPVELDLSNAIELHAYVETLPVGAYVLVLCSWTMATLVGGVTAALIGRQRPHFLAGVSGVVIILAVIPNLRIIPYPNWFVAAAILVVPLAAWAAGVLAARRLE